MVASSVPAAINVTPTSNSTSATAGSGASVATTASGGSSAQANSSTTNIAQTSTATSSSVGADPAAATDFVSMLTQLLSADTSANTEAVGTALDGEARAKKQEGDDNELASDAASIESPLVADITQIIGIAQGLRDVAPVKQDRSTNSSMNAANVSLTGVAGKEIQANVNSQIGLQQATSESADGAQFAQTIDATGDAVTGSESATQGDGKAKTEMSPQINSNNNVAIENKLANEPRYHSLLQERVGTPAWRDEVGAKLHWMIERGVQSGSLRLSPEHLGPMEVKISVQNDQVSVWFGAAHADTRSALENAIPRLRDMLATQGMSLADAGVFREPPKEQRPSNDAFSSHGSGVAETGGEVSIPSSVARSLLDTYA